MPVLSRLRQRRQASTRLRRLGVERLELRAMLAGVEVHGPIVDVNGVAYFAGRMDDGDFELWKSDGTAGGTSLVKEVTLAKEGFSNPAYLINSNGTLFFRGDDGTGSELWVSDGTAQGTVLLEDIDPGVYGSSPSFLADVNGILYFTAFDGASRGLWKTNGTFTGTEKIGDVRVEYIGGDPSPAAGQAANISGQLFFKGDDGINGVELWQSDGTEAGTVMVKDIRPGAGTSGIHHLTNLNGVAVFSANDGTHGYELWKHDRATGQTALVKEITPGASGNVHTGPEYLTAVEGTVFFSANDGVNGRELWKSNGSASGTTLVKNIGDGAGNGGLSNLTNIGGTLFFRADDGGPGLGEVWTSDGTQAGTVLVKDVLPGASVAAAPSYFTDVSGRLFFSTSTNTTGSELWKTDGTTSGTVSVKSFSGTLRQFMPGDLSTVGGRLFFAVPNTQGERLLWVSDGTADGTRLLLPGSESLITVNSTLDNNVRDSALTLREAILISNDALAVTSLTIAEQAQISGMPGETQDTRIGFNIPGSGVKTISPSSALPTITSPVIIDGYTQPGAKPNSNAIDYYDPAKRFSNGTLLIELSGANAGGVNGLRISAGGSTVRGLIINRFQADGTFDKGNAIFLESAGGNTIAGNFLGATADGTARASNDRAVWVQTGSSDNTIGGITPGSRNLVSANNYAGLAISSSGNLVQGNFIGTTSSGMQALGNLNLGVAVLVESGAGNVVGGTSSGARNIIAGQLGTSDSNAGVYLAGVGARVQGNFIGTDVAGSGALGNLDGIVVDGSENTIGGKSLAAGNRVAFNDVGLVIRKVSPTSDVSNPILGNSFFNSSGLAIDLNDDGPTANDTDDADTGPNLRQNFPVISAAALQSNTLTVVQYLVPSPTNHSAYPLRVEFFLVDPTFQRTQTFIGFDTYTAEDAGTTKTASIAPAIPLIIGDRIMATATDSAGHTSEFGAIYTTTQSNLCSLIVTHTQNSGAGSLREAIKCANTNNLDDVINVPSGTYTLSGAAGENSAFTGDLDITEVNRSLTIRGAGPNLTIINGGGGDRVFEVRQNVTAVIENVSIVGGSASTGGGLLNSGNLTLNDVTVRNNAAATGGGIHSTGELTLNRSQVRDNTAASISTSSAPGASNARGGGISASLSTTPNPFIMVVDSTIDHNAVSQSGTTVGGFTAEGGGLSSTSVPVTVLRSAIRNNSVTNSLPQVSSVATGGGIAVQFSVVTISGSAIENNSVTNTTGGTTTVLANGGGIYVNVGSLTVNEQSSVVGNSVVNSSTTTHLMNTFGSRHRPYRTRHLDSSTTTHLMNTFGGGIFFSAGTASPNTLTILDSEVSRNTLEVTTNNATSTNAVGGAGINTLGGTIEISNTTIAENRATGQLSALGGGLRSGAVSGAQNASTITLTNVFVSQNVIEGPSSPQGGGIGVSSNVTINLFQSAIDGNRVLGAAGRGGGIEFGGTLLNVMGSTISGNEVNSPTSATGGGIHTQSAMTLINSTVSGNTASGAATSTSSFGGISTFDDPVLIRNSTITGNRVINGNTGGLDANPVSGTRYVTMENTIVAGNFSGANGTTPSDIGGSIDVGTTESPKSFNNLLGHAATSGGLVHGVNGNIVGNGGSGTIDINTVLNTTLADNGGRTKTHALANSSPAIDSGSNDNALDGENQPLSTDQRGSGFDRFAKNIVDIGAYEVQDVFPWHNLFMPLDVRGGSSIEPDGFIDSGDALAIINYVNTFGAGPVPLDAEIGLPFGYLDTNRDNSVAADDALSVINAINSGMTGEGESQEPAASSPSSDELLELLAVDAATQAAQRKRVRMSA